MYIVWGLCDFVPDHAYVYIYIYICVCVFVCLDIPCCNFQ